MNDIFNECYNVNCEDENKAFRLPTFVVGRGDSELVVSGGEFCCRDVAGIDPVPFGDVRVWNKCYCLLRENNVFLQYVFLHKLIVFKEKIFYVNNIYFYISY